MVITHVVGAGLAGLACAVRLARRGRRVALYEAAGHAGGRCRSFFEDTLGRSIDNGNHVLLGNNAATMSYLDEIGARDSLASPPSAVFPFVDLRDGARWTVRPNAGPVPWWLFAPSRRVAGSRPRDYLSLLGLARAGPNDTVAGVLDTDNVLFERFWRPLATAVLNTETEEGAARLFWHVLAISFGRGGGACRPYVASKGLSASFVDPAVAWLGHNGCEARFGWRLRGVELDGRRAARLDFGDRAVVVGAEDKVVLAVPPARVEELLPEVTVPRHSRSILNVHYRLARPVALPYGSSFLGLIGGSAEWVFVRDDVASVTVSAADGMLDTANEKLAPILWADVARALEITADSTPPYRIVKERRATFAQTPEEVARRPPVLTRYTNLLLAGDWTDTGLPATIEGAVRSGHTAARLILRG